MKQIIQFILLLISTVNFGQSFSDLKQLEGIWIADTYYNEFIKTKSAVSSKSVFGHSDFVGLRINTKEITNNRINIGIGVLHDHIINPEVSIFTIVDNDTIYEQNFFDIQLNQKDSSGFVNTSSNDKILLDVKNCAITIIRKGDEFRKGTTTKYIRVSKRFSSNYEFPNPIYYFTTKITLEGTYIVKDSINNIVESNLLINSSGIVTSNKFLNLKKGYFSTDVYCGPPLKDDYVIFCDKEFSLDLDCIGYVYKRINENSFRLYNRNWITINGEDTYELSNYQYEFIKK